DPTVDSQVVALKSSGADIFVNIATPKFAAQAIKKVGELGWKPIHILNNVSSSIGSVLKPAGFENAKGVISTAYQKDPSDPGLKGDPGLKNWTAFMDKYFPEGNKADTGNVTAYVTAKALVQVLKQCGDNLTRENVMRQAANLKDFEIDMLLDGIKIGNTNPYSGPASAYGLIGKTIDAYFKKVNAEGGINGRKVNFISYDDGYSPPKAVEQVRKLVESDEVLLVFQPLGTPSNTAIQKYLNSKKVPQLFVATGATKW